MAVTVNNDEINRNNTLDVFFARRLRINWEVVVYIVLFALAVFTRFYMLGERVMSHDESLHTVYSHNLYDRGFFEHSPLMHGPILFHFTALSYFLFGVSDFTARIYTAVVGVIVVMFPLLLRRWLGRSGAVLATIMLLISPLLMYYSRYIRHDLPSILSALVMFWATMMYLNGPPDQRRRAHWLYILSAAMLWNLGSKETAFIYIAIFGAFLLLYWLVRVAQHIYDIPGKMAFYTLIMGILLAGVGALAVFVVLSVSLSHMPTLGLRLDFLGEQFKYLFTSDSISVEFSTFLSWTGVVFAGLIAVILGPALWAYRRGTVHFLLVDAMVIVIAVLTVVLFSLVLSSRTSLSPGGETIRTSTAAVGFAVGLIVACVLSLIYAFMRIEGGRTFWRQFGILVAVVLLVGTVLLVFEELSHAPSRPDETAAPVIPGEDSGADAVSTNFTLAPLALVWVIGIVAVGTIIETKRRGLWEFFEPFPEFDVLMVMGSLILPWLTAVFIVSTHASAVDFVRLGDGWLWLENLLPVGGAEAIGRFIVGFLAFVPMLAMAIAAGLAWNWRRWIVCAAVFHALFAFFFTTVFTNIEGIASGWVYSLQYWLEQQGVRRGSQPQYYYSLIVLPIYEFLPIVGSLLAMVAGMVFFWRKRREYDEETTLAGLLIEVDDQEEQDAAATQLPKVKRKESLLLAWHLNRVPFLLFMSWWAILNLVGYTLAGEKMPWLGTHMTVPMIFLAAWYFGRIVDRVDGTVLRQKGWVYLLLLPFLFIALAQVILPFLGNQRPFSGTQSVQLEWTYAWLATVIIAGVVGYVVYRLMRYTGWPHLRQLVAVVSFSLLVLITFKSAWAASFINYDLATEFLVYAHGAPGNKQIINQLADISVRTTGGMDARILYDNKFSWPGSWYMRDFKGAVYIGENAPTLQQLDSAVAIIVGDENRPKVEPLVEDRFQRFDYKRLWWPMQDYFGFNATRLNNLFDLSDANAAERRHGIFDIWWRRDYTRYGEAVGRSFALTRWPVSDDMSLFLRKDIAAQVWVYGVGGGTVENPFITVAENLCVVNWDSREARVMFDTSAQPLLRPLGIAIGGDGLVYVAEEAAHRISIFTHDGQFIESFGQHGTSGQEGAFFERPHSVALDASGDIFVVDTWNYRVRRLDVDYSQIASWGQPLTAGFDAPMVPIDGFWGPRDIALDTDENVYISDTGNKRIRVYMPDGTYLYDIGGGGSAEGQLNEPAGIAIHPDGRLFVADTWNRRVAVFALDGTFLYNFSVRGWYDELGNRPYLAVDPVRDLLYVTDPDAGRVLIYTTQGECVSSFGQFSQQSPGRGQFSTLGGIAVDSDGNVYVTDLATGRILRFDPYEHLVIRDSPDTEPDGMLEVTQEVEAVPEVSAEVSAEAGE